MNERILQCGCHKVDMNGNIFSRLEQFSEKGKRGRQVRMTEQWRLLAPTRRASGYYQVAIHGKMHRVNRLIALTFLSNPAEYPEVHHINGDRSDNRGENLRWGDQKQNAADRVVHGTAVLGSKSPNSKLTEDAAIEIRDLRTQGMTYQAIARRFGVSKKLILLVTQNKIWRHI
jgi:hypothetical protein